MLRCAPYYYADMKPGRSAPRASKDFQCLTIDVFGAMPESGGNTRSRMLNYIQRIAGLTSPDLINASKTPVVKLTTFVCPLRVEATFLIRNAAWITLPCYMPSTRPLKEPGGSERNINAREPPKTKIACRVFLIKLRIGTPREFEDKGIEESSAFFGMKPQSTDLQTKRVLKYVTDLAQDVKKIEKFISLLMRHMNGREWSITKRGKKLESVVPTEKQQSDKFKGFWRIAV
ncbi:hypothetical protein T265_11338 [Opisthorchis viverrini]|uniref:Uncharacterized protein n=1 Tax=Opisthorchis viverrini TaxID=6198 RepID=A0A074YZB9_OPIVI|nr:hypothetical protein T265_11338 [Opisthorchis viverrini]KER20018.1 hypothetical protein T265_11338 [Opisthorchis viverrini]